MCPITGATQDPVWDSCKDAGSQRNPKTSLHQRFLLLMYGASDPTAPGDRELGIRAADGLWKGIPCNGEGTEASRKGRTHQGPQPEKAESFCKGTELRSKIPSASKQRWGNTAVQQSQRKIQEDRLVDVSKGRKWLWSNISPFPCRIISSSLHRN